MKKNAYSFKDQKAGTYSDPYYAINDATASRSFSQACDTPDTMLNQYPEDFSLFKVGEWDDTSASLKGIDPVFIMNGKTQIKPEEKTTEEHFLDYVEK
jgi:hypothetical protein